MNTIHVLMLMLTVSGLLYFFSLFIYMPFYAYLIKKHHPHFFSAYFNSSIFYAYMTAPVANVIFFIKKLYMKPRQELSNMQPYKAWNNIQGVSYSANKWVVFHGKILTWIYAYAAIYALVNIILILIYFLISE